MNRIIFLTYFLCDRIFRVKVKFELDFNKMVNKLNKTKPKRIVTNSDLDALVSAVLLKRVNRVGTVKFVPHEDIRENKFRSSPLDIVVNFPYLSGCKLWFDHHSSNSAPDQYQGRYNPEAPSAARVIYNHYREQGKAKQFAGLEELLAETDRVDSADFEPADIESPSGAVLLSFLIDSHPLQEHTAAENQLLIHLLDSGKPEKALEHPVIKPRADKFKSELKKSKKIIQKALEKESGLLILDYRKLSDREREFCQNKFIPFILAPESHSLLRIKNLNQKKVKLGLGFNMFLADEKCPVHYGNLLANYEGGGHARAAGCSVSKTDLDEVLEEIKSILLDA